MTISTTRSRIRTIGSTTLAAAVGLGMGALSVATAPSASAAEVTKDIIYACDVVGYIGTSTTPAIKDGFEDMDFLIQTTAEIPATVTQGATIPVTPATITLTMPKMLQGSAPPVLGTHVKGSSANTNVAFTIEGTKVDKNLTAPGGSGPIATADPVWSEIPTMDQAWTIPVKGEVPAVTVPGDATGTVTIEAPSSFTINAWGNDGPTDGPTKSHTDVFCDLKPGQPAGVLLLGDVPILDKDTGLPTTPSVATTLAGTAAPSAVGTNATVNVAVTPATATGDVALALDGVEIAKGTLENGAASIVVPAASLPEAKTYTLQARYPGAKGFKPSTESISVVRNAPPKVQPPVPNPVPDDAKIKAKAKPSKFKMNKTAKLKITIKSASTSLAGKIKVKVGKKTIGKGKVKDNGKATIKLKKIKKKYVKKGKIKLKVTYGGNATTEKAKKTVKVKVKG